MENQIVKIKIDRIEENTVIAFSDCGKKFVFPNGIFNVRENDICNAVINDNGTVLSIEVDKEETANKKQSLMLKLKKLFAK